MLLAIPLLAALLAAQTATPSLQWERDWAAASERAWRERKLVVVFAVSPECRPCPAYEETTLRDPGVEKVLADFVPLRTPLVSATGEANSPAVGLWIFHPDRTPLAPVGFAGPSLLTANLGFFRAATADLLDGAEAIAGGRPYEGHMEMAAGLRSIGRTEPALEHFEKALEVATAAGDAAGAQRAEIEIAEAEAERLLRSGGRVDNPAARLRRLLAVPANLEVEAEALRSLVDIWRWSAAHGEEIATLARVLERAESGTLLRSTALELAGYRSAPEDFLVLTPPAPLVGELPVEVAVRDRRVVRVDYWLDGERVGSSNRAPFGTTISVGDRLRRRRLEARAFDRSGGLLARHAVHLNLPEAFFEISLLPPQRRDSEIVLEATPVVGRGRTIDRVEFRIGSEPAGTVRRPPYRVVIPADAGSFARAIAWDSTGDSREAFVFLDPATVSESVDVNLVEILVNVDDRDGRPIVDLRQEEFRIREKGSPRTVRSAKLLSTEPLLLGLAVDRSKSLYGVMDRVVSSALEFAARATRGGEIFVVGFDHRAEVLQWKTADADDVRRKLADLEASGNTALREAMLYSLMQYQNSSGNRILVVLTDGVDTSSRYDLDELERVAGEFAVPIYIVLFETTEGRGDAKRIAGLKRIAEMSGGRTFELASLDALDAIWRRIQLDVDTRYLLVYPTPLDPDAWRPVEVATGRNGSRVRAVKGLTPSISQ